MSAGWRRGIVLLATVVGVAATGRLGAWQLSRAAQKEALQASLDTRGALPPLPAATLARDASTAAAQWHRRIVLSGRWLPQHSVFLDNRQMNGRPGFFLLTPLEFAPGDAVLVQRGWAPRDLRDRALLPEVPTPGGAVRLVGQVAPPPSRLYSFAEGETGRLRQNIDIEAYARETGLRLRPLSIVQTEGDAPDDGLLRQWPRPAVDVHKHYGYAFQWFALATLLTGLYVWFQLLHPWLRRQRTQR
ncbi:SURF1 family protein [Methylibium sp.]|uniref:SURF1 family protein n=1 Tax=Methylibium sp. TaxID=2067992 RepID=UPI003D14D1BB